MRLSIHQRKALEKVTGKYWNIWNPKVLEMYFAFTDRGKQIFSPENLKEEFEELMHCHRFHAYSVECWKEDFKKGLLFLWDFLDENHPKAYIDHAFEIYETACGSIPTCYREHKNCPERFK